MATEGEFFKHQSVCLEVGNNQRMRLAGVSDLNFKINVFSTCFHRLTTGIDMKMWCININALSSFQFHFIKYLIQNNSRSFCKWEKLKLTEITWFTSDHTTGKWQSLNQDPGSLTPPTSSCCPILSVNIQFLHQELICFPYLTLIQSLKGKSK